MTDDRLASGDAPGGSSLYAGLAARALGAQARVVTSAARGAVALRHLAEAGVVVEATPSSRTTCFENRYIEGVRHQRVLAVAAPLETPVADADVVFACPVIGEVMPEALVVPPGALLGAGLQGWLRKVEPSDGTVSRLVPRDLSFLSGCEVIFCSVEDLGSDAARLVPELTRLARIVVVTDGARGAAVHADGQVTQIEATPVREVDPTGAGDVFAAAFLLELAATRDLARAGVAGACAGAIVVQDHGPEALPHLARLDERIAAYQRRRGAPTATGA